jgi:O-antigen/teichoic acid export membrane protein
MFRLSSLFYFLFHTGLPKETNATRMNLKDVVRRAIKSPLLFTICVNIILAFLSLISGSLTARLLGVSGRGELAAIQLWPTFLAGFSILGLSEAIIYFTAKEPQHAGNYLVSAMGLTLLASVPFMALGYIILPVFLVSQSSEVVAASRICLLMIPIYSIVGLPFQTLRGRNDMMIWNLIRLAQTLLWICILLFIGMSGKNSPQAAAFGYLWMYVILCLPVLYIVFKRVPGPYQFEQRLWHPLLRFGLPSVATSIPVTLNLRLDQLLMAAFLMPQVLGLYVVAVAWAGIVSPLLNAFSIVIFPQVASQFAPMERTHTLIKGIHLTVLAGICMTVPLMALTPLALPLIFGDDFRQAIPSALILIFAGVISNVNTTLGEGMRGFGKPTIVLVSECIGLVITILMLFLLLKPLGIVGASVSSVLGYSATMLALLFQISRIVKLPFLSIILPNRTDVTLVLRQVREIKESI